MISRFQWWVTRKCDRIGRYSLGEQSRKDEAMSTGGIGAVYVLWHLSTSSGHSKKSSSLEKKEGSPPHIEDLPESWP